MVMLIFTMQITVQWSDLVVVVVLVHDAHAHREIFSNTVGNNWPIHPASRCRTDYTVAAAELMHRRSTSFHPSKKQRRGVGPLASRTGPLRFLLYIHSKVYKHRMLRFF